MLNFSENVLLKLPDNLKPFVQNLMWNPHLLEYMVLTAITNNCNSIQKKEPQIFEPVPTDLFKTRKYLNDYNTLINVFRWFFYPIRNKFINFEGVDATGKGTQSKILFNFFTEIGLNFTRMEIPNYSMPHGKLLKNFLQTRSEFNPETTENKEINTFDEVINSARIYAINRYEALNSSVDDTTNWDNHFIKFCYSDKDTLRITDSCRNGVIMDRWVDSSIAFSVVHLRDIHKRNNTPLPQREKEENILVDYIKYLEYDLFKLNKPDLTIILVESMETIGSRIRFRKNGSDDGTLLNVDKHESNLRFIEDVQDEYLMRGSLNPINTIIIGNKKQKRLQSEMESIENTSMDILIQIIKWMYPQTKDTKLFKSVSFDDQVYMMRNHPENKSFWEIEFYVKVTTEKQLNLIIDSIRKRCVTTKDTQNVNLLEHRAHILFSLNGSVHISKNGVH